MLHVSMYNSENTTAISGFYERNYNVNVAK